MLNENGTTPTPKRRRMWCVTKKVYLKDSPELESETVSEIVFGQGVYGIRIKHPVNGKIEIEYQMNGKTIKGWGALQGFSTNQVENYAGLFFTNGAGKRIPTAKFMFGKVEDYILPGERVTMLAKVGDWCLTNRGWSKFKWFTKERDVYDPLALEDLLYAVLAIAVKDYKTAVKRILEGRYEGEAGFIEQVDRMDEAGAWFHSDDYAKMFDPIPGKERFNSMNKSLGVDNDWIKKQLNKRDKLLSKRTRKEWRKKKRNRDTARRYKATGGSAQERGSLLQEDGDSDCPAVP